MARPGLQPNAQIIGRLDLPFGATVTVRRPGPDLTEIREEREARLILTDPTVWTGEAWGALAAVPVIPVDAGSAVVAAGRRGRRGSETTVCISGKFHTDIECRISFQAGIFSPVSTQ